MKNTLVINNTNIQEKIYSDKIGLKGKPFVFIKQGICMLATVLKSKVAADMTVRTFANMKQLVNSNNFYINQLQIKITKLKEYKMTLIDNVVTRKVRVCDE
jgi:hypothetical protein